MINKIYKTIHNKYFRFFKFIFFIRYLIVIFFVAMMLLVSIPQFFDYKKKEQIIKTYLVENYGLEVKKVKNINFKSFPVPHLQLNNLEANFNSKDIRIVAQILNIYPKIFSIYNYNNFDVRKIRLDNNNIEVRLKDLKLLFLNLYNLKKKIHLNNLDIQIKDQNKKVISLKKINFYNYGYEKNKVIGEVFNKKFKINFLDDFNKIKFSLLDTGLTATLDFKNQTELLSYIGSLKGKVLSSNFKLNFIYDKNSLKINKFFFRDKNLAFDSEGYFSLKPFFKINLDTKIKDINKDILTNLNINYLLNFKDLIKRLNSNINIVYNSKKFSRNLINNLNVETRLAYGRLNLIKDFSISDSSLYCKANINLIDEYPIFHFNCNLNSPDKKKLLKSFKINYKTKNEKLNLIVQGSLNILNNKINFDKIEINNVAVIKEDLKYIKDSFEKNIFNQNFTKMFEISKIKNFILEIS